VERWIVAQRVFLVDGTYELFRHYYGVPSHRTVDGAEVAATRGVLSSMLQLLAEGVTHLGVATDHVIESFRNDLWPGYKSSAGVEPALLGQFGLLEVALEALGVKVWPMIRLEADDALASAAAVAADDTAVDQVVICTPDKDLGQCVDGGRIVQLDRRKKVVMDEAAVTAKFGVAPKSIPDYLALVGDSSDGYPGLPGWGAKSTALVLTRYKTIEDIPDAPWQWDVSVRNGPALAATLAARRPDAMLFKDLATLRIDRSLLARVEDLRWAGPTSDFATVCDRIDAPPVAARAVRLAAART
jgi:5'-3' exonuclease